MPPLRKGGPGGAIGAVLDKFRTDLVKAAKVTAAASKEREEKLKQRSSSSRRQTARGKRTKSGSTEVRKGGTENSSGDKSGQPWLNEAKDPNILPLGMRQKQVLDFLKNTETPASAEDILTSTGRHIESEPDLKRALDAHPKISIEESTGYFVYLPDANVRNKNQLLDYIRTSGTPIAVPEILDSYRQVLEDIEDLKKEKKIIGIHSYQQELNCEVLYAMETSMVGLKNDPDIIALWTNFPIPDTDEGIDEALDRAGIQAAPRKEKPKRVISEKKRKKRKQAKLRAVTNAHLMHLLEGEGPAMIDG
eukprot:jgi/Picsp_1/4543/NSC_06764-R1_transcription initiation